MDSTYSIEVTTAIGCRNRCAYCPQEQLSRRYALRSAETELSLPAFRQCLEHLPAGTRVYFSGFAEPWQNPRCTDMVEYACTRGFRVFLFSTAVGMRLADVERLAPLPLGGPPCIHLPDDQGWTRIPVSDGYLEVLGALRRTWPEAAYVCPAFSPDQAALHPGVRSLFRKVTSATATRSTPDDGRTPVLFYRAVGRANQVLDRRVARTLYRREPLGLCLRIAGPVLLPNGEVVLCCADYQMRHVLGNLLGDDLSTILTGPKYARVLRALGHEGAPVLCRRCEYATGAAASDAEVHARLCKLYADKPHLLGLLPAPAGLALAGNAEG